MRALQADLLPNPAVLLTHNAAAAVVKVGVVPKTMKDKM